MPIRRRRFSPPKDIKPPQPPANKVTVSSTEVKPVPPKRKPIPLPKEDMPVITPTKVPIKKGDLSKSPQLEILDSGVITGGGSIVPPVTTPVVKPVTKPPKGGSGNRRDPASIYMGITLLDLDRTDKGRPIALKELEEDKLIGINTNNIHIVDAPGTEYQDFDIDVKNKIIDRELSTMDYFGNIIRHKEVDSGGMIDFGIGFADVNSNDIFIPNKTGKGGTVVKTITEVIEEIVEQKLTAITDLIDKTEVTEMVIDKQNFKTIEVEDRQAGITKFSFEYLAYLFFEVNIEENLPNFYSTIDHIIKDRLFDRDEDPVLDELTADDIIDDETKQLILDKIWALAKKGGLGVQNLIGFYIYYHRRLKFLPVLIKGVALNDFISKLNLTDIIDTLITLGLYPVNNKNLFDRLWDSFVYSVVEDGNKGEIKMSLAEYYQYKPTRNTGETYTGFTNRVEYFYLTPDSNIGGTYSNFKNNNDKLLMFYDLDLSSYSELRTYKSNYSAFNSFKKIVEDFKSDNTNTKEYLLNLLPNTDSIYMNKTLINQCGNVNSPDDRLWEILETFNEVYRINRLYINKGNISRLFNMFANTESFPIGYIDNNDYTAIWFYWIQYLNSNASKITETYLTDTDVEHTYDLLFRQLTDLVNSKYIIQYLQNNNSFREFLVEGVPYSDGANYINAALLKVYESLDVLKAQLKELVRYTTVADRRFKSVNAK